MAPHLAPCVALGPGQSNSNLNRGWGRAPAGFDAAAYLDHLPRVRVDARDGHHDAAFVPLGAEK